MSLPLWVAKLLSKQAAKSMKLEEGPMQEGKPWYKSKGVLTGIVTVLIGSYETARIVLAPQLGWHLPEIPPIIYTILGAIGIYSRVTATQAIK